MHVGFFYLCCLDVCLHAMNGFLGKVDENNITVTSYQRFTEIPTVQEIDAYLNIIKKTSRSKLITYYLKIIQSLYEIYNNRRHFFAIFQILKHDVHLILKRVQNINLLLSIQYFCIYFSCVHLCRR